MWHLIFKTKTKTAFRREKEMKFSLRPIEGGNGVLEACNDDYTACKHSRWIYDVDVSAWPELINVMHTHTHRTRF